MDDSFFEEKKVSEIIWMMFKTDAPFYLDSDRIVLKTLHDLYRQGVYHNRGIDRIKVNR